MLRFSLGTLLLVVLLIAVGCAAITHPTLVWSQVVLSFGVPFALIPLIWLTRRRDLMGDQTNHPVTTVIAGLAAALIIALNMFLIVRTFAV